jgi:hypothetical protein
MPDKPVLEWFERDPSDALIGERDLSALPREFLIKLVGMQTWENVVAGVWPLTELQLRMLADVLMEPFDFGQYDYIMSVQTD